MFTTGVPHVMAAQLHKPAGKVRCRRLCFKTGDSRPEMKRLTHVSSCYLSEESAIDVWDLSRPYLPALRLREQKDPVMDFIWGRDGRDLLLSCAKVCCCSLRSLLFLCQFFCHFVRTDIFVVMLFPKVTNPRTILIPNVRALSPATMTFLSDSRKGNTSLSTEG